MIVIPYILSPRPCTWLNGCLVGDLLSQFFGIFSSPALVDCSLKYIWGLNVLLDFRRRSIADVLLKDHIVSWRKWFDWLHLWDESFVQTQRIMWIKISGMLAHLLDSSFFDVVARNFGRILILFDCSKETLNLSFRRVCILARHDHIINPRFLEEKSRFWFGCRRMVTNGCPLLVALTRIQSRNMMMISILWLMGFSWKMRLIILKRMVSTSLIRVEKVAPSFKTVNITGKYSSMWSQGYKNMIFAKSKINNVNNFYDVKTVHKDQLSFD